MATIALPYCAEFENVESDVERVKAGVTFAQRMSVTSRVIFGFVYMTKAFNETVARQGHFLNSILDSRLQNLNSDQLITTAEKLEELVRDNEFVIQKARKFHFKPWEGYLDTLEQQAERIASIAESFRMGADAETTKGIVHLAACAAEEATSAEESDWRDFVATLHD